MDNAAARPSLSMLASESELACADAYGRNLFGHGLFVGPSDWSSGAFPPFVEVSAWAGHSGGMGWDASTSPIISNRQNAFSRGASIRLGNLLERTCRTADCSTTTLNPFWNGRIRPHAQDSRALAGAIHLSG